MSVPLFGFEGGNCGEGGSDSVVVDDGRGNGAGEDGGEGEGEEDVGVVFHDRGGGGVLKGGGEVGKGGFPLELED